VFYRRIRASWPAKLLDFPADLGTILFLLFTIVFLTALVFAVKPYYRAQIGYGSPPIAIRSGLMAFACVPILVALAGKANIVTFFTGISRERLNVLHRWVAWISFALSLFHALPYFVGSVRNAISGGEAQVEMQFYMYGKTGANEVCQHIFRSDSTC
jgi:predicted ferric reductase